MTEGPVMYDPSFIDLKSLMVSSCEWDEAFEGKSLVFSSWIKLAFLCTDFMLQSTPFKAEGLEPQAWCFLPSGCSVKLFYSKKNQKWNNAEHWHLSHYIIYAICKVGIFGNRSVMGLLKFFTKLEICIMSLPWSWVLCKQLVYNKWVKLIKYVDTCVHESCMFIGVKESEFYYINMGMHHALYDDGDKVPDSGVIYFMLKMIQVIND